MFYDSMTLILGSLSLTPRNISSIVSASAVLTLLGMSKCAPSEVSDKPLVFIQRYVHKLADTLPHLPGANTLSLHSYTTLAQGGGGGVLHQIFGTWVQHTKKKWTQLDLSFCKNKGSKNLKLMEKLDRK